MANMINYLANGVPADQISSKSRSTYIALAIFLGFIGVHNFYAGRTGRAILGLFTGGLCGLLTLIDIISVNTDGNDKIML